MKSLIGAVTIIPGYLSSLFPTTICSLFIRASTSNFRLRDGFNRVMHLTVRRRADVEL